MQERLIERKVREYAIRTGWCSRKLKWIGRWGAPDRFFAKNGIVVLIELKQKNKKPTAYQAHEHEVLRSFGVLVFVCDSVESAKAILDKYGSMRIRLVEDVI